MEENMKSIWTISLTCYLFSLALVSTLQVIAEETTEQDILEIGHKAPSFETMDDGGKLWQSKDHVGKGFLVIYFYPAAMTGGCTKQACSFRDDKDQLAKLGIEIIGISGDPVKNLQIFKIVHNLNFTLLSDENGAIAQKFGVPIKEGGSIVRNVNDQQITMTRNVTTARWTFIIDKNGKIIYKNIEVNAANDSKDVLEFIQNYIKTKKPEHDN